VVSGGGSWRGGRVDGGEGGELELGTERSEVSVTSPNWRARGESREGNGVGSARAYHATEAEREEGGGGRHRVGSRTMGPEWL
jgi:hypothetical protein